jgi:dienelactone hydrolase
MTESTGDTLRRTQLQALLGDLPPRPCVGRGSRIGAHSNGPARIEQWRLDLNGEAVPAWWVTPSAQPPRAIVLYCHAHGNRFDIGKDELLRGRPALTQPPYGEVLPALGFAALAIDHRGFGERAQPNEPTLNKRLLFQGRTLWGMRIADTLAAFDWLRTMPQLHGLPIIVLGLSMGSTMAWWTAALEPGIAACVDLCGLSEFDALVATGNDVLHGEYWFVPGLGKHFTAAAINALIAPRPHLSCAGAHDPLTPPAGLQDIDSTMRAAYLAAGAPRAWRQRIYDCGHVETLEMRSEVLAFLDEVVGEPQPPA